MKLFVVLVATLIAGASAANSVQSKNRNECDWIPQDWLNVSSIFVNVHGLKLQIEHNIGIFFSLLSPFVNVKKPKNG